MKRKHPFNMIEIMLALGVCAIGISSIMVLFPVGSAATRDAAMETYAAHAADQMLHFMKYRITANDGADWATIISDADDTGEITQTPPADKPYSLAELNDTSIWKSGGSWIDEMKGTVYHEQGSTQTFQILSHRNGLDALGNIMLLSDGSFDVGKIDYRGILTIWKEQIVVNTQSIPYTTGVKLNIKVAWPAELPEASRQEAYYSLEVFKP